MPLSRKLFWVAVLYLAEGFPFGIVKKIVPVYLRQLGVSLVDIGFISGLVALPWTLKVLWAPAVDRWGSRRTWIVVSQSLISLSLLTLAAMHSVSLVWIVAVMLLILAFFAATQDIAIDAYTIGLLEKSELGPANGVRVTAYRVALITAGGLFVAVAGIAGWSLVFLAAALLMAGFCLMSFRAPAPEMTQPDHRPPQSLQEAILAPLRQFLSRSGFLAVALFILTFKLGDMALGPMVEPFWVDRQFSLVQIGLVPGTLGVLATISGALLGGVLTRRWGIFQALWILGLLQAVSNLIYAAAAALPPSDGLMYSASIGESFCGGLGTAPFLAFLMSICDKAYAATQYALLSSLFGLTGALSGAVSGLAAQSLGYATYFTLTFFLAWPAYLLLPWVKQWTVPERESQPV
jgi:PAT family beta-lactamase induction signal transducer AmpG